MKHRTSWEDDQMAGISCYVHTEKRQHPITKEMQDYPTDGGSISSEDDDAHCESCGQPLRLEWIVRLVEVVAPSVGDTPSPETP